MATFEDQNALKLYITLMEEIKERAALINTVTAMQTDIPKRLLRELCYLQLRMMCELIAAGCLIAHGDITNTKFFRRDAYKADEILRRLEGLHQDFYPIPGRPEQVGPGHTHFANVDFDYLSKSDLIKLYGTCGDILHKGRLPKIITKTPDPSDFEDVKLWGQKLLNLLSAHRISRIGGCFHFVVFLAHAAHNQNVYAVIAESPKP